MSFTKPTQPDFTSDTPAQYKTNIDGAMNTVLNKLYDNTISLSAGTGAAYTANIGLGAYSNNQIIETIMHTANTGTCTINFDSLGAKTIKTLDGSNLVAGRIEAGLLARFYYDGVDMIIINPINAVTSRGCLAYNTSNQSIINGSFVSLNLQGEIYDTDGIHSTSSNTSQLVVPAGVTKVKVFGQGNFGGTNNTGQRHIRIYKNGSALTPTIEVKEGASGAGSNNIQVTSPVLIVTPGDYFQMKLYQTSGGTGTAFLDSCWFCMEIKE